MTQIYLTHRAINDLKPLEQYSVKAWGRVKTVAYMKSIEETFSLFSKHPNLLKKKSTISAQFRVYNIRQHWLICEMYNDTIYILTVKHISQNVQDQLKELAPSLESEVIALKNHLKNSKG